MMVLLNGKLTDAFCRILEEELLEATGCTEPIAIAYCAAKMRAVLGADPEELRVQVSGNILKNVKSVVVPNTGGRRGVAAAVAVGIVAGDPDAGLQVLSNVREEDTALIQAFLEKTPVTVECIDTPCLLDILVSGRNGTHSATVRIANNHTNIVHISRDDDILLELPVKTDPEDNLQDKSVLNIKDIVDFAENVELERIRPLIESQIRCNSAIAEEGLRGSWGSNIGSLLAESADDPETQARSWAAAASDARMSGCEMPVVIVSGSGNQGITASVPVWRYGVLTGAGEEKILRAVCLSDLITIHQKTRIGRLSAYCGAVSAGTGAGCGIAWLRGADAEAIAGTLQNAVAILSGTICDGAKASCAAKIAMAVEAGLLGHRMVVSGNSFRSGDGIVGTDPEDTIVNVGTLASEGMREEDKVILTIMTR